MIELDYLNLDKMKLGIQNINISFGILIETVICAVLHDE